MSAKSELINNLIVNAVAEIEMMDTSDDEESDEILDDLEDDLSVVYLCRYSYQSFVPKNFGWYDDTLFNLDERRFKKFVRCDRQIFNVILNKIKDHHVYHGKNSEKQFSPFFQLALVLYRLGSSGDGASISKIAGLFGVGDGGTIDRITTRVFKSVLALEDEYLNWPSEMERSTMVYNTKDELPYCIGYVDGSEIPLEEAPIIDKESYYSRSKIYSLKLQAICDHTLKIRHVHIGYPGSVHDARIFNSCKLAVSPQEFFSGEQWIAADSAYRLTRHVITPFRKNNASLNVDKRKNFNQFFSSFRVRIEHCFGILKEIFPSLKNLRLRIYDKKSHQFACTWIRVCCILYNIILPYIDEDEVDYLLEECQEDEEIFVASDIDKLGEAKRMALVEIVLE